MKKTFLSFIVFWFGISASFAFAQTPSCENFNSATYTITNNGGDSRFLIRAPIETNIALKAKNAGTAGENVDIVLVMDRSGSMRKKKPPTAKQTKMEVAKSALNVVVDTIAKEGNLNNRIALVTFASDATLDQPLTNDYNALKVAISKIVPAARTSIGGGLLGAASELKSNSINPATRRFIILASDGLHNTAPSIDAGIAAVPLDTTVYTVGIGSDADPIALQKIANTAGAVNGAYFFSNVANLVDIFQDIAKRILGAFTLQNVSMRFTRDDITHASLTGAIPAHDFYDSTNGIIRWNNLGNLANGQQKNIAINYQGIRVGRNIPLDTSSLLLNYTVSGKACSEEVPVNVLLVDIADLVPPLPSCTDATWTPSPNTVCTTRTFTQTSNCGAKRSVAGAKLCAQCSDGIDNDNDGHIDYPMDPGCYSPLDDNEKNRFRFFQF